MTALVIENLSKDFDGLKALDNINLTIAVGERRAIIGPNGAGKTTLFNLIAGALSPSSGRVYLFGREVTKLPMHRRISLGMARTFQLTNLFAGLTLRDNLLLAVQGLDWAKYNFIRPVRTYRPFWCKVQDMLEKWELADKADVLVKHISYGEQRQLEILLGLAANARLLLLDEPTAGLAPGEVAMVTSVIGRLPKETTVLFIEHETDVAFQMATWVTVLYQGKLLAEGSPEEICRNASVNEIYLGAD